MIYGEIVCIGDSLTEGSRDEYKKDYPFYLENALSDKYDQDWICHNEGVAGEISYEILQRSYRTMSRYPDAKEVVINCGTNDGKNSEPSTTDGFRSNLKAILRRARILNKRVFLTNIPPLKGFGAPDDIDEEYLKELNEIIEEEFWSKEHVYTVNWRDGLEPELYSDGVHFNASGYRELAERVKAAITDVREY